jgi:hypothetical protein
MLSEELAISNAGKLRAAIGVDDEGVSPRGQSVNLVK